jgi:hypothetical protein
LLLAAVAAGGALLAAPVPAETRKPAAFPAGHYVLAGAGEAAQGDDVYEFTKSFRLKPGQYVLSGGPKPTDLIFVDDDLRVYQDKTALFVDADNVRTSENRGKRAAQYQGKPIILVLNVSKKLRIVAIDHGATEAIVGELWLHRWDGARKKLTAGKREQSAAALPATFFEESFALGDGFEMPEKVSTDAAIDVPEKPATLLPRFKPAPPPAPPAPVQPVRPDAVKALNANEFVHAAVVNGLTEDGAAPALAGELGKRDADFVPKCFICDSTRSALKAYAKCDKQPAAKEGRGLSEELVKRLQSGTDATRRSALRDLVQRYIDREYARRDLTTEQKTSLQTELEKLRKLAMGALRNGQKFCPSCDGACCIVPRVLN